MPNSQVSYLFFVHFSQITQNLLPFLSISRSVRLHTVVAVIGFVAYTVDIQDTVNLKRSPYEANYPLLY